jgi:hypothetical protein
MSEDTLVTSFYLKKSKEEVLIDMALQAEDGNIEILDTCNLVQGVRKFFLPDDKRIRNWR